MEQGVPSLNGRDMAGQYKNCLWHQKEEGAVLYPDMACNFVYQTNREIPGKYIISKYDSKLIDYVLSGSEWCDHMYHEGLIYDGKIIKTGTPRCDVLVNQRAKKYQQFRKEYNIPADTKILLYAPTFRGGSQSTRKKIWRQMVYFFAASSTACGKDGNTKDAPDIRTNDRCQPEARHE